MKYTHNHPSYVVELERVADGERRLIQSGFPWDEGSEFWWTKGNQGCDCNRQLAFERASPEGEVTPDENLVCGDTRYRLVRVIFSDGSFLLPEPLLYLLTPSTGPAS